MKIEHLSEDVRVILGDCREVLPTLGHFDAIVTDPPYGIGESAKRNNTRGKLASPSDYGADNWDSEPPSDAMISLMRTCSKWQVIFGGNFFQLPPTPCWLIWDKENTGDFADCELAWTNIPRAVRRIRWMWNGMLRKGGEPRFHLTQKPLGVMKWALDQLPPNVQTVCDPYAGSGTTGVACVERRWSFTGIEREAHHFDTSCRRISDALSRPDMFVQRAPEPKQEGFTW